MKIDNRFRFSVCALFTLAYVISSVFLGIAEGHAKKSPSLKALLGSWGGSGVLKLESGKSERIRCNGYYTGGGSQLGMVIRCTSKDQKIEMRSKLSLNADRISGNWEERTYNAEGQINGRITSTKMNMSISGSITGTMNVQYSRTRQNVSIRTNNVGLQKVDIVLTRR